MKWTDLSDKKLLDRSFAFGLLGITLALLPLVLMQVPVAIGNFGGWLSGLGIALQLLAMSLAVLVIRQRKIAPELQQKAKQMTLVLAVALLFFILV
nr:hypothetical protein [Lunatimonas salinarum]